MEQTSSQSRFSPEVENVLRQAGWFPGRVVPDQQLEPLFVLNWPYYNNSWFQTRMFSRALHILREFHGLSVVSEGPGVDLGRESFTFDPLAVRSRGKWSFNWCMTEWAVESSIYPLGYTKGFETAFGVDLRGRIIEMENGDLLGDTLSEGLESMILGKRAISLSESGLWAEASLILPALSQGIEAASRIDT